jgi:hypothetical protein
MQTLLNVQLITYCLMLVDRAQNKDRLLTEQEAAYRLGVMISII